MMPFRVSSTYLKERTLVYGGAGYDFDAKGQCVVKTEEEAHALAAAHAHVSSDGEIKAKKEESK